MLGRGHHVTNVLRVVLCRVINPSTSATEQVFLDIEWVDIEFRFDRLLVFDGDYGDVVILDFANMNQSVEITTATSLYPFQPPDWPSIRSTRGRLTIYFESDVDVELSGFHLTWRVRSDLRTFSVAVLTSLLLQYFYDRCTSK